MTKMAKILSNSGNKKRKIKAKGSNVQGRAVSLLGNGVFFFSEFAELLLS